MKYGIKLRQSGEKKPQEITDHKEVNPEELIFLDHQIMSTN